MTKSLFIVPRLVVATDLGGAGLRRLSPADLVRAENDIRTTLLQGLGGLTLLIGAYLTWRQIRQQQQHFEWTFLNSQEQLERTFNNSQQQFQQTFETSQAQLMLSYESAQHALEASRDELALNREALQADRFINAVEQVGSQDLAIRTVGLHTLEHIVRVTPREAKPVARALVDFIVNHAPWTPDKERELAQALNDEDTWIRPWGQPPVPPWLAGLPSLHTRASDVYRALEMLCHIPSDQRGTLMVGVTDLRKLRLGVGSSGTNVRRIHFNGAHFEGSYLVEVDFSESELVDAHFEGSALIRCKLSTALDGAHFDGAMLESAFSGPLGAVGATFRQVSFRRESLNMRGSSFRSSDFRNASLIGATFIGANLESADLRGADLTLAD